MQSGFSNLVSFAAKLLTIRAQNAMANDEETRIGALDPLCLVAILFEAQAWGAPSDAREDLSNRVRINGETFRLHNDSFCHDDHSMFDMRLSSTNEKPVHVSAMSVCRQWRDCMLSDPDRFAALLAAVSAW